MNKEVNFEKLLHTFSSDRMEILKRKETLIPVVLYADHNPIWYLWPINKW